MVERIEEMFYILLAIVLSIPFLFATIVVGIYFTVNALLGVYDAETQIKKYY